MRLALPFAFLSLVLAAPVRAQTSVPVDIVSPDADPISVARVVRWHPYEYLETYTDAHGHTGSYVATGYRAETTPLCTAPCRTELPEGRVTLVVADSIGSRFVYGIAASPGDTLYAHIERRGVARSVGHWILSVGLLGGAAWASALLGIEADAVGPAHPFSIGDTDTELANWIGSAALATVGLLFGLPFACMMDSADVTVIPGGLRF